METVVCPICKATTIDPFCRKNGYQLYRCCSCFLVFVWPMPGNLDSIYTKGYFKNQGGKKHGYFDYDQDKEPMKEVFASHLEIFAANTKGRDIFDIGAATGYFLDMARGMGWQTSGIEISSYAAEVAARKGHDVKCGILPDLHFEKKASVVTMWDVLEHVDDPHLYIRAVNNLLHIGGLLAINTIDKGSLWARLLGSRWHLIIPPEHLFYYTRKSLELLLRQNGFTIIEVNVVGKKFTLAYIFTILYNWQGFRLWHILACYFQKTRWRKFGIPINLRDNIFIFARKITDI